jgi:RNA polymerase sigma factor (sigma-70 family)
MRELPPSKPGCRLRGRAAALDAGEPRLSLLPSLSLAERRWGCFLAELSRVKRLSAAEEVALAKRIERGDPAAKRLLLEANLKLVVALARRYQGLGLPLADLSQEGTIGLIRAVDRFDWRRGYRFSTYGGWWIRQALVGALADQGRTIRLPRYLGERRSRLARARERLVPALGREPTGAPARADPSQAAAGGEAEGGDRRVNRWRRSSICTATGSKAPHASERLQGSHGTNGEQAYATSSSAPASSPGDDARPRARGHPAGSPRDGRGAARHGQHLDSRRRSRSRPRPEVVGERSRDTPRGEEADALCLGFGAPAGGLEVGGHETLAHPDTAPEPADLDQLPPRPRALRRR